MPARSPRVSLAQLLSDGAVLDPRDAAAIVSLLGSAARHGQPADSARAVTPGNVWLDSEGTVEVLPPGGLSAGNLGTLLEILLLAQRRQGGVRVPPGLLVVTARATGQIDAPPFASPAELSAALSRFTPPDSRASVAQLFAQWHAGRREEIVAPAPQARPRPALGLQLAAGAAVAVLVGITGLLLTSRGLDHVPVAEPIARERIRLSEPVVRDSDARPARAPANRAVAAGPKQLIGGDVVTADAVFSPSFASNGSAVFFHAQNAGGSALKRADRGEEGAILHVATIVDDGARNYHVQLSPDGEAVAFDSDRDGVRGVYVARPDGTGVERVSGEGYAAVPTWSPDSRRLALLRAEQDRQQVWNLWVLDLSSREMTRLTNHRYGQVWSGTWFPDGRRIAYSHEDRLIILDMTSAQSEIYPSPRKRQLVRTPAVSPDGRWIMFQVFRDGAWLFDLSDGSMRKVLDDPSAEEFTWSPDGRSVAFHSRRSGEWALWMMAPR
ncbi:MAG TPA: hypothetical protein VHJ77_08840 [Vicinamibacterales bacterium]|nr:hypothetical protein [Vicinamibacterales bacterium]